MGVRSKRVSWDWPGTQMGAGSVGPLFDGDARLGTIHRVVLVNPGSCDVVEGE